MADHDHDHDHDPPKRIADLSLKLSREKALIHASSQIIQSTKNTSIQDRADRQIREGREIIKNLEGKMRELQQLQLQRRSGSGSRSRSSPGPDDDDGRRWPEKGSEITSRL